MYARLGVLFLLMGLGSFPADTSQTLHERYGQPISETYLIRSGIAASARYGASQRVCAITVYPEHPKQPLNGQTNSIGDWKQVVDLLNELVPKEERGKYLMGTFLDFGCIASDGVVGCGGVEEDWEKLTIRRWGNSDAQHSATIRWKRDECRDVYAFMQ